MPPTRNRAGTKGDDVTVGNNPTPDRASVDAGAVGGQPEIVHVDVRPTSDDLGVQPRHAAIGQPDVDTFAAADRRHLVTELEHFAVVLDS